MISHMWHLAILKRFPISYQILTVKSEQNTVCRLHWRSDNDITLDLMHFSLSWKRILLYVMCKLILMIKVNNVTLHMRLWFEPFEDSPNQLMKFGVPRASLEAWTAISKTAAIFLLWFLLSRIQHIREHLTVHFNSQYVQETQLLNRNF